MADEFEFDDLTRFEKLLLRVIRSELPQEYDKLLKDVGMQFMRNVAKRTPVDTGRLRASLNMQTFHGKKEGEIRKISRDTIECGTNVEYAPYVEDGHMQKRRWVPGYWKGYRRVVTTSRETGEQKTATRSRAHKTYSDATRWASGGIGGGNVKFVYDPTATTGMMLTNRFIPGKHMFKIGIIQTEKELPELVDNFIRRLGEELGMDVS